MDGQLEFLNVEIMEVTGRDAFFECEISLSRQRDIEELCERERFRTRAPCQGCLTTLTDKAHTISMGEKSRSLKQIHMAARGRLWFGCLVILKNIPLVAFLET